VKTGWGTKAFVACLWLVALALSVWCLGALWFQPWAVNLAAKKALLWSWGLLQAFLLLGCFWRRAALFVSLALSLVVVGVWRTQLKPTGRADWDAPFARMPVATFSDDGRFVTVDGVRDFHYRTETDYDVRYRKETYDLDALETLDYSVTHWNGHEVFGHVLLSFGFKDGRHLVLSPEARLTKGHVYELFPGFYRQYELIFICATEEDAIQLRTHHRRYEQSEVFLYPTYTDPAVARFLLTDLLKRANGLREHPEFYNGLTYNCLSSMAPTAEKLSFSFCSGWRGMVNGLSDRWGWHKGWLRGAKPGETFEAYRSRHSVNQYVEKLVDPPDFSQLIRPD